MKGTRELAQADPSSGKANETIDAKITRYKNKGQSRFFVHFYFFIFNRICL